MKRLSGMILILCTAVGGPAALAADGSSSVTTDTAKKKKASKFGLSTSLEYSSNFYEQDSYENSQSLSISSAPSYKISPTLTGSAQIAVSKDLKGPGDSSLNNISLRLSKAPIPVLDNLQMSSNITGYLPTNESSRENAKYQGSLAGGLAFSTRNPVLGMSLSFRTTLKKDFNEYETDNMNNDLTNFSISHSLGSSFPLFSDKVTLSLSAAHSTSQTHRGNLKNIFTHSQSISYEMTQKVSLSMGHANQAAAQRYDGVSNNIKFFDEKSSSVYLSLSMSN